MNRSYMASIPGGVTEVEFKRSLSRIEQDSARRGGSAARAESKAMIDAAALQLDMSRRFNLGGGEALEIPGEVQQGEALNR